MFAIRIMKHFYFFAIVVTVLVMLSSCANMVPPVGGPRDSLPPQVIREVPENETRNFRGNRITLQFDEYVQVENAFENVIVSPTQESAPIIDSRLRTVTIRLRDTLEPNTTYSIQFGNAIKDVNEGNPLRNFSYVFSTGNRIDSLTLTGNVTIAQTGKVDSTLIVMLHRNLADSAVAKQRPRFYTKLDRNGNFRFDNLPPGRFKIYALKDEGFKRYTDGKTAFAFADSAITISRYNKAVNLFAFVADPGDAPTATAQAASKQAAAKEATKAKQLQFQVSLASGQQDLISPLQLSFSQKLKTFDSSRIVLTDTNYRPVSGYTLSLDTSRRIVTLQYPWQEAQFFRLVIPKDAVVDSADLTLGRNDTIRIRTKAEAEYGSLRLQFNNLDFSKNPVLLFVQSDKVVRSEPLTTAIWRQKLFAPGSYDLRILYDANKNGIWDTGDFSKHRQPERVFAIPGKTLNVRANWDNEVNNISF